MKKEYNSLGNLAIILKCILAKKGMSQTELATATGLSGATITHYINGKSTPSQKNLIRIADFLGVPPRVFYSDVNDYLSYLTATEAHFSGVLSKLIDEKKITQASLGKALGVSRQTVNMYVNGRQLPSGNTLKLIAEYFGVTTEYLIEPTARESSMVLCVKRMPYTKDECIFIVDGYSELECKFGGLCDLCDGKCSHLKKDGE